MTVQFNDNSIVNNIIELARDKALTDLKARLKQPNSKEVNDQIMNQIEKLNSIRKEDLSTYLLKGKWTPEGLKGFFESKFKVSIPLDYLVRYLKENQVIVKRSLIHYGKEALTYGYRLWRNGKKVYAGLVYGAIGLAIFIIQWLMGDPFGAIDIIFSLFRG
ncbi:MAG: hypothetical protein F6K39_14855 [Okeania sp. SIO3B3]|nr:hypothetical protein [Okeania sp. SIO3B3]